MVPPPSPRFKDGGKAQGGAGGGGGWSSGLPSATARPPPCPARRWPGPREAHRQGPIRRGSWRGRGRPGQSREASGGSSGVSPGSQTHILPEGRAGRSAPAVPGRAGCRDRRGVAMETSPLPAAAQEADFSFLSEVVPCASRKHHRAFLSPFPARLPMGGGGREGANSSAVAPAGGPSVFQENGCLPNRLPS